MYADERTIKVLIQDAKFGRRYCNDHGPADPIDDGSELWIPESLREPEKKPPLLKRIDWFQVCRWGFKIGSIAAAGGFYE